MIIEKEENQPKKTPLNLQNLAQPLESTINLIIYGKIYK